MQENGPLLVISKFCPDVDEGMLSGEGEVDDLTDDCFSFKIRWYDKR